jgi:presqualene diphosphate synthase
MRGAERQSLGGDGAQPAAAGSSFYLAMRILPKEQREAMYQVYAFCRAVDDIADDSGPKAGRLAELEAWRGEIEGLYAGKTSELTKRLIAPVKTFGLNKADFLAVIDGMEMDVARDIRSPNWDELDLYCDRVASAVGRLSARIFGIDDTNGRELSHHLGRALQMTNILRDLDEDSEMGRLYLPKEALREADIKDEDFAKVLSHSNLDQACGVVAMRARDHFAQADSLMEQCTRESVRSPRIMASVYRALLDKLIERGWAPPRQEVRPSKLQFAWAVMRYGMV